MSGRVLIHRRALGNVASEMAGQSVLQTNSPANRVTAALTSANKSKAVSRANAPRSAYVSIADGSAGAPPVLLVQTRRSGPLGYL